MINNKIKKNLNINFIKKHISVKFLNIYLDYSPQSNMVLYWYII